MSFAPIRCPDVWRLGRSGVGARARRAWVGELVDRLVFVEEAGRGIANVFEALRYWAVVAVTHDVGDFG